MGFRDEWRIGEGDGGRAVAPTAGDSWRIRAEKILFKPEFLCETTSVARWIASLLLALFSFGCVAPLLASDPDSNLPACCRRFGAHKCGMENSGTTGSGPALHQSACPQFPGAQATPALQDAAVFRPAEAKFTLVASSSAVAGDSILFRWMAERHVVPKRGPPSEAV
jgi:hypothetical protein